jgi:DNA-3-methyladenine glycosylase II
MDFHLTPDPPYDVPLLLDFLSRYEFPSTEQVSDGAFWRVLRVGAGIALIRAEGGADGLLHLSVPASSGPIDESHLLAQASHILAIHEPDRGGFFDYARGEARLWEVVAPCDGLPLTRTASVFEALMMVIIEQQIAWRAAQRAQAWLLEWAGESLVYRGRSWYSFPTPERIAGASVEDLNPLKITFKRMGLMINLAREIAGGRLDFEPLRESPPALYEALIALKGIGPWTAAVVTGRATGHHIHVTGNDVALQAAANRYFYAREGRCTTDQLSAAFAPFGEWGGIAAIYTLLRWVLDEYPRQGV